MSILDDNKGVRQRAQEPSKRVGSGQNPRVPTHEGSQLGTPTTAGKSEMKAPHLQGGKGRNDQ